MQFRDLKTQYKSLQSDIDVAILEVARECNFIMGRQVKELEETLADHVGAKHCITCANGTDALSLAMMIWDIGEGDAVFVPDFTFFSSGEVVSHAGATPIFVDVDKDTFNLDPEKLNEMIVRVEKEGRLTPKAIIAVDLFGLPADFSAIRPIADEHGIYILEDGAQGYGGSINGKMACSFGDLSTTSFFPAKPLGCYGDGGAIFTDNDEWAKLAESYRVHGKGDSKYDNVRIGLNSRLDTMQAAVLQVKLRAFRDYEVDDINKAADFYSKKLKGIVKTPAVPDGYLSSWAQYTLRLEDKVTRDALQEYLKERGVPTMVYYQKPMHKQEAFDGQNFDDEDYVVTNKLCDTVLSLPMHPYLTVEDINTVTEAIKAFRKIDK
jgi:UDP-2-acetamido-2-deoxy-ribo-hexuluronate aminotransferase